MSEEENIEKLPADNSLRPPENNDNVSEPSDINTQPPTENMEVHHHPKVEKKNFKEYFLEFLMIFLAVTMGFFAENFREHISDNDKAKVFAASLYQDFKTVSSTLNQLINFSNEKIKSIDSLDYFIHQTNNRHNDSNLYSCAVNLISTSPFDNINGTYEQIRNSGSLRFFNQSLINNLNSYDATSLKLKQMEDWENKVLYEQVIPKTGEIFNFYVFDDLRNSNSVSHEMYLRNLNEESIDILLNQAIVIKHLRERQLIVLKGLLQKSNEILAGLKKEYHLENE